MVFINNQNHKVRLFNKGPRCTSGLSVDSPIVLAVIDSPTPVLFLQAYMAYLTGMLRFEHQEWKAAMEAFNKCK